jgi:hypothetical protein
MLPSPNAIKLDERGRRELTGFQDKRLNLQSSSRGDKTAFEHFAAEVRGWDVEMRRRLAQESNVSRQ